MQKFSEEDGLLLEGAELEVTPKRIQRRASAYNVKSYYAAMRVQRAIHSWKSSLQIRQSISSPSDRILEENCRKDTVQHTIDEEPRSTDEEPINEVEQNQEEDKPVTQQDSMVHDLDSEIEELQSSEDDRDQNRDHGPSSSRRKKKVQSSKVHVAPVEDTNELQEVNENDTNSPQANSVDT